MNFFRPLTLLVILFWMSPAQAQPWMEPLRGPNPNFFEARRAFNDYWKDKEVERGRGYKPFRRWEWYWQNRVSPDGAFPPADITRIEWEKYLKEHEGGGVGFRSPTGDWAPLGPSTTTGGYNGLGRINCIAFHPTNNNIIYVGAAGGGIWKTPDGGASWSCLLDDHVVLGVSGIVVHPTSPNTIYIATGDGDGWHNNSTGVLKSTNGGASWSATGLEWEVDEFKVIRKLIMHPSNTNILMAASSDGIWRTTNGGASWSRVISGDFYDIEARPNSTSTFYAGTKDRIYRSANSGASWSSVRYFSGGGRVALAVTPANSSFVGAVCARQSDGGFLGFYASTNGGSSFSLRASSPNILNADPNGAGQGGQGSYDLCISISPTNASLIHIGGVNTWKSTNGGYTWRLNNVWSSQYGLPVPEVHADKHDLIYQNSTTLFEANDGGIYRSTNGGSSWADLSDGLMISQMYRLGVAQSSSAVLAGLQDNSTKFVNASGNWADVLATGDGMECAIDPNNANYMYTESYYGNISRSTNGGTSWHSIKPPASVTGNDTEGAWVTPFVLSPANSQAIFLGYRELYRSTNRGTSWSRLTNGLTGGQLITHLAVAPGNANYIYLVREGWMENSGTLFRSTNGGASWSAMNNPTNTGKLTCLAVSPTAPNTIWATVSNYSSGRKVFKSTNSGASWSNVSGSLPNLPANCIVYQNGSNDGLYVGMDAGVYYRDNSLDDWILFSTGLPTVEIFELEIYYAGNRLRAATYGRGLWESDLYAGSSSGGCGTPSASQLSAGNITASSAILNCSVSGASRYDWRYRKVGVSSWTNVASTSSDSRSISGLSASTDYEFQASVRCGSDWTSWSASRPFTTAGAVNTPANDNACGAVAVSASSGCGGISAANVHATTTGSPGTPSGCPGAAGGMKDVWFKVTLPSGGRVTLRTTPGSLTDAVMAVYYSSSGGCGTLQEIACEDDECNDTDQQMPEISLVGSAGQVVYARVWGYDGASGTFGFCAVRPPNNDEPCSATNLTARSTCSYTGGSNIGATYTTAPGYYGSCPISCAEDVWYRVVIPSTGIVTIRTAAGTLDDAVMSVYYSSSGNCSTLYEIGCEDDNTDGNGSRMPAMAITGSYGQVLYVRIWGWNGLSGTFNICALNYGSYNRPGDGPITVGDETAPPVAHLPQAAPAGKEVIGEAPAPLFGLPAVDLPAEGRAATELPSPAAELELFPVPADEQLNVRFQLETAGDVRLEMYSQDGRLIQARVYPGQPAGAFAEQLPVQELPAGVYLLRLSTGQASVSKLFVKAG